MKTAQRIRDSFPSPTLNPGQPLTTGIEDGQLVIRVGIDRLNGHADHPEIPQLDIKDPIQWTKEVAGEMTRDRGDGATPISLLVDSAIRAAIENGSSAIALHPQARSDDFDMPQEDASARSETPTLTPEQYDILHHTLHRAAGGRYCGGGKPMLELVALGLMEEAGKASFCPETYYRITTAGRNAYRASPLKNEH